MRNFAQAERDYERRRDDLATSEGEDLKTEVCGECDGSPVDDGGDHFDCPTCKGVGFVETPKLSRKGYWQILAENYNTNEDY